MRQKHEAQKRLAAAQAAAAASAAVAGKKTEDGGHAISKEELQGLLKEFAPDETFEDGVEELLLERLRTTLWTICWITPCNWLSIVGAIR